MAPLFQLPCSIGTRRAPHDRRCLLHDDIGMLTSALELGDVRIAAQRELDRDRSGAVVLPHERIDTSTGWFEGDLARCARAFLVFDHAARRMAVHVPRDG